jgi:hypothetical protein
MRTVPHPTGIARYPRFGFAEAAGDAVGATDAVARGDETGVALPAGKTPTPESGDAEAAGDGFVTDGAADGAGPVSCFSSSRRSALSPLVLCA